MIRESEQLPPALLRCPARLDHMPLIPNPFYLVALQWLIRNGAPIVMQRLARTKAALPVDEQPRFEGEASLERGGQRVPGWLAITSTELRFEPSERRRGASVRVPLSEIEDVSPTRQRLLGVIPSRSTGNKVQSGRGIYRFTVDAADRGSWLRELSVSDFR